MTIQPLVAIFTKNVATLSLHYILLRIHQYKRRIIYKDDEIPSIKINIGVICTTTDIPNCMNIQELQQVMTKDGDLQQLREHIIRGLPWSWNEVPQEIRLYWTFRDDMAVKYDIILKGIWILVHKELQKQAAIDQLVSNHMGIKKMRL